MEQTHIKSFGLRLVLARHVITQQVLPFNGEGSIKTKLFMDSREALVRL